MTRLFFCMIISVALFNSNYESNKWIYKYLYTLVQADNNISMQTDNNISLHTDNNITIQADNDIAGQYLTAMDALDLVKKHYAANFEKVYYLNDTDLNNMYEVLESKLILGESELLYYYKLKLADYFLVYEGLSETGDEYLIHLYEFVTDDFEDGIGHTVTYGWFNVDKTTGVIKAYMP